MKCVLFLIAGFLVTGCVSTNISMAHTSGTADDVIDDTNSNAPNINANVTLPIIPSI